MTTFWSVWNRFWFSPQPTSTLALLRIWFGLVALGWTVALTPDLGALFSRAGVIPAEPGGRGVWSLLGVFPSDTAVQLVFCALLLGCLALLVGFHTRLAALVVFLGILSFERRNPFVFNSGDGLVRLIAFFLMLTPAGVALSVDRWRSLPDKFWDFPSRQVWGLRLIQVQLSIVYFSTFWLKLRGTTWNNGTAVSYAQRLTDLTRFGTPSFLSHSAVLSNLLTYGTLVVEIAAPILIWNRRLRPYVAVTGICLHVGIDYSIRVGFFGIAMITLYLSFLDPHWAANQVHALRLRLESRTRRSRMREPAAAEHAR